MNHFQIENGKLRIELAEKDKIIENLKKQNNNMQLQIDQATKEGKDQFVIYTCNILI